MPPTFLSTINDPWNHVLRHVVTRTTENGNIEYLIDLWGNRASFDPNPVKAKIAGYAWAAQVDAERKRLDTEAQCRISGLELAMVLFQRNSDGTWSASQVWDLSEHP